MDDVSDIQVVSADTKEKEEEAGNVAAVISTEVMSTTNQNKNGNDEQHRDAAPPSSSPSSPRPSITTNTAIARVTFRVTQHPKIILLPLKMSSLFQTQYQGRIDLYLLLVRSSPTTNDGVEGNSLNASNQHATPKPDNPFDVVVLRHDDRMLFGNNNGSSHSITNPQDDVLSSILSIPLLGPSWQFFRILHGRIIEYLASKTRTRKNPNQPKAQ